MAVPQLRFKQADGQSFPDWIYFPLSEFFGERSERNFSDSQLLSVTLNKGVIRRSEIEGKDNSSADRSNYKRVCPYDIAYNSMRMWQGASGVSSHEGIVSPAYTVLMPKKNCVPIYFGQFFKHISTIHIFQRFSQGLTSDTWNLKYPELSKIKFWIPQKEEQQKIAFFLTAVDERIRLMEEKHTHLEQYKKGVMQQIFSQKIRFKKDDGSDFPDWERLPLKSLMTERKTQEPQSKDYPLMAFIAHKGVFPKGDRYNRDFLVKDSNKKYKRTEYGDFIYSSNNLESGSIGLNTFGSASISPVYSIFSFKKNCHSGFLGRMLLNKDFIHKMTRYRQGVVYGQWRIHESDFLKIKQNIPDIGEQKKIARFLTAIDNKIETLQSQITEAKTFKKGLLQQMFV